MIYKSQTTEKGNSSFSFESQEEADLRAKALDYNGCVNCSYCSDCSDCEGCNDYFNNKLLTS